MRKPQRWNGFKPVHGKTGSKVYNAWRNMKSRCEGRNFTGYENYGGRGIKVCERWHSFQNFYDDMGEPPSQRHSLDRLDNSRGYEKDNCGWRLPKEQMRNIRTNRLVEYGGHTVPLIAVVEELGLKYNTVLYRLKRGWSPERAFGATKKVLRTPSN